MTFERRGSGHHSRRFLSAGPGFQAGALNSLHPFAFSAARPGAPPRSLRFRGSGRLWRFPPRARDPWPQSGPEALADEAHALRPANLLRNGLLEAGKASLLHADRDLILQFGPAQALAYRFLPASRALLLHGRARADLAGLVRIARGVRRGLSERDLRRQELRRQEEDRRGAVCCKCAHAFLLALRTLPAAV